MSIKIDKEQNESILEILQNEEGLVSKIDQKCPQSSFIGSYNEESQSENLHISPRKWKTKVIQGYFTTVRHWE